MLVQHRFSAMDICSCLDAEAQLTYMLVVASCYDGCDDTGYALAKTFLQSLLQQCGAIFHLRAVAMP
jgi:hypothetical protein